MSSFYVYLPPEAAERLREIARRELRSPRHQATVILLHALGTAEEPRPVRRRTRKPETEAA